MSFLGNLNLNCLIHEGKNQTLTFWPAWTCIEGSEDPVKDAEQCVTKAGLSWANVHACATGQLGQLLVNAAADATQALSPAHKFVPWVTVNGSPLGEDDLDNIISIVCNDYQGATKPSICSA
jgi:interferon gamma-inducible protein 30